MRGKRYDAEKRRVLSGGGYIGVIIAIVVLAALVATTLLVLLPTTEESTPETPTIVSISYEHNAIGAGTSPENVYFTVVYSDGTSKDVALSSMNYSGLDVVNVEGTVEQTISVSYGGFEHTLDVKVKRIDCELSYETSKGGRIQGDSNQTVVSGADAKTVVAIPETGYVFVGWSDGYPYATRQDLRVNESQKFIAIFERTQYEVIFFFRDGSTVRSQKVYYGERALDIPDENDPRMKVYGYTFMGWSVAEEDYACVTRDMNIYPRYEKTATDVTVTVSKDKDGNEMGETDANECGYYAHGVPSKITAKPYNSRVFKNWAVKNSDGVYVDLGKSSTETVEVKIGDNKTPVVFRVAESSTGQGAYDISFTTSAAVEYIDIKAEFAYQKSNVTFVNYQNDVIGNVEAVVGSVNNEKNQTLGERIVELEGIKLDNGEYATIETDPSKRYYGLLVPKPVAGMEFLGWYMQTDPTQTIISREQTFVEPTILIAKWAKKRYQLIFQYVDNMGTTIVYSNSVYVYYQNTIGSGGGIPAGVPYRDMYVFKGWVDAYTGNVVDDSTQIIMQSKYEQEGKEDFDNNIIRLVASWNTVKHDLNVKVAEGSGEVKLATTFAGETTLSDIYGTASIAENSAYNVTFKADSGYKIRSILWCYGDKEQVFDGEEVTASGFGIHIEGDALKCDNSITVKFVACEYFIDITNGNALTGGYVTTAEGAIYDAERFKLKVNANAPLYLTVTSRDTSYAIEKITVSGKIGNTEYDELVKYSKTEGQERTRYELAIESVCSDLSINITYEGRLYNVTVNQTAYPGGTYPVMLTAFNGREDDYKVPDRSTEYIYGERVFYAIKAEEGKYISGVSFDGIPHDLYERSSTVYFYDWEVNGKYLGISLMNINDEYYYCYGKAGVEVFEENFLYCEKITDGTVTVFEIWDEGSNDYSPIDIQTERGKEIAAYLVNKLDVASKKLSDMTVGKDNRVTSVKLMLVVQKNVNVSVKTSDLTYSFNVEENDYAETEYNASTVARGGYVTLSITPANGYKIVGYEVNGERRNVLGKTSGEGDALTVSDIREDVYIRVICEAVKFNIVFANVSALKGDLYVSAGGSSAKNLMATTYAYEVEYGSGGRYTVTASEGKRIIKVKINGTEQPLVYNAKTYVYANYRVMAAVRVEVECADIEENDASLSHYTVHFNASENVFTSVRYATSAAEKNTVTVISEKGYKLSKITVSGLKNGVSVLLELNFGGVLPDYVTYDDAKNTAIISLDPDGFDGSATVTCVENPEAYTMITDLKSSSETGSIFGNNTIYYGTSDTITVSANSNYYIHSFKVNGESVSMLASGWKNRVRTASGKYTYGVYTFTAAGPVVAEVEFRLFTYKVTLDSDSINGKTDFIIDGEGTESENGRIAHGYDFTVSMKADPGYHISKVFVNGKDAGYRPYTDEANNNTTDVFTISVVTGDVNVYVLYEINRYEFTYSLVNDSANFKNATDTGNSLTCPDAKLLYTGCYGNIAHGDNFSFIVTPGTANGYYVYSIRIVYSKYMGENNTRLRYAGDGFGEDGGTIWFNKFLWDNSASGSVGVTANIQLIEVVFKKRMYPVRTQLDGGIEDGGRLEFAVSNSLNPNDGIYLFGEDQNENKYKFMFADGKIYKETSEGSGEYALTDIVLTRFGYDWDFYSASENKTYVMSFEHGLRYTLTVAPVEGYERSKFTVVTTENGGLPEDKSGSVYNDKYSFNVYRETLLMPTFTILRFDISVTAVAYQANSKIVSERDVQRYASVVLVKVENGEETEIAKIGDKSTFNVTVDYGTMIKLVLTPNFEEKGSYLLNLQTLSAEDADKLESAKWQQVALTGDTTGTTVYGGTGLKTTANYMFRSTFRIMEYQVRVVTAYEEDGIRGESINSIASDSTGASIWKVTWNNSTDIKVVPGKGYYVNRVLINYVENGESKTAGIGAYNQIFLENGEEYSKVDANERVICSIKKNVGEEDALYGIRDIITLPSVKSNYTVTAYFARESYDIIYSVNNTSYISDIKTVLNENNPVYPTRNYSAMAGDGWKISGHYYDEITATLTPLDGYEIVAAKITVECVELNGEGEYIVLVDENGDEMKREFALQKTGRGDEKLFTFHKSSNAVADYYVRSNVRITVTFSIKEYRVGTTINRTRAGGDTSNDNNDTAVTKEIVDKDRNPLKVAGSTQTAEYLTKGISSSVMTAQHHGYITYTFKSAEGYYLSKFVLNGFTLEELIDNGIAEEYTMAKEIVDGKVKYAYKIVLKINSTMIAGSSRPWVPAINTAINVSMDFTPINYVIRLVINGNVMPFITVDNRMGVSDGEKLKIYASNEALHFSTASIDPSLYEGYKISDPVTGVYFGTADGCEKTADNSVGFMNGTPITSYRILKFSSDNLKNADISQGKNYIYFYFTAEIITYTQTIRTEVYGASNIDNQGNIQTVALSQDNAAGKVIVTVLPRTGTAPDPVDMRTTREFSQTVEYFTTINIEAEANPGFVIYGIYEVYNGGTSRITSGSRNIIYSVVNGKHSVTITVRDLPNLKLENRTFIVDFKQQATVTLTVANPYKYIESTRRYTSYANVTAYTSEREFPTVIPSDPTLIVANNNVVSGEIVVEKYVYTVYIGNYIKFNVIDRYQSAAPTVHFSATDLSKTGGLADDTATTVLLQATGKGARITVPEKDYYVYVDVSGRVTTMQKTVGAVSSATGGKINYNNTTSTASILHNNTTYPSKTITLTVTPAENYVFYQLKIRQPLEDASRRYGWMTFPAEKALEWNSLKFDAIGDSDSEEQFTGTNKTLLLSSTTNSNGSVTFTFWICGDIELEVEYYRVYDISYGVYMTDKVTQGNEELGITTDGIVFTPGSVEDAVFGEDAVDLSKTKSQVSYGATFEIEVRTPPTGEYQFVGWYVNGYNMFKSLQTLLPDSDCLIETIKISAEEMPSLIVNGQEVTAITVYAIFQPIIDVMVYNEKYYAYPEHFNSWNLATVLTSYYDFERGEPVPESETTVTVPSSSEGSKTIQQAITNLDNAAASSYTTQWADLLKGEDAVRNYNDNQKNAINGYESYKVYSWYKEFTVLYQNISSGDFFTNSWQNTEIIMTLTGLATSARFAGWQYYNWKTNTWCHIPYKYEDMSFGLTSSGRPTEVDCFFTSYSLNLKALYERTVVQYNEEGDVITDAYGNIDYAVLMPYAININNRDNTILSDADANGVRPLLLRPDLYQTITVNLLQNLYKNDLDGENPEDTMMVERLVQPRIMEDEYMTYRHKDRTITAQSRKSGVYEYGTSITITNFAGNASGKTEIIDGGVRYRFLGWFMKYNKVRYYLSGSEFDGNGGDPTYELMLTCLSNRAETDFVLIAIYVAQYKQEVYSYNISGGQDDSYAKASASRNSVDSAPTITFAAKTNHDIVFDTFSRNGKNMIVYEPGQVNKRYWINTMSDRSRLTTDADTDNYSCDGKAFEYFLDAGLTYSLALPNACASGESGYSQYQSYLNQYAVTLSQVQTGMVSGYCPDIDTPYTFIQRQNGSDKELLNYSNYYNTGNGTYYVPGVGVVTALDLHRYANLDMKEFNEGERSGVIETTKEDACQTNEFNLRYVTTATLIFYNITYKSGISVPASLAKLITGGKINSYFTVWDEDTVYGDYNQIETSGGKQVPKANAANGEVVIRVTLKNSINSGFQNYYYLAYAGMESGNGFKSKTQVLGPAGNGLFVPSTDGTTAAGLPRFQRWREIDMTTLTSNTALFGNPTSSAAVTSYKIGIHAATPSKYTTTNCGDPINGYRVVNEAQIKNIREFWFYNEESCVGIINPKEFKFFDEDGRPTAMWEDFEDNKLTATYKNHYGRTKFILTASVYNLTGIYKTGAQALGNIMSGTTAWTPLFQGASTVTERYVYGTNIAPTRTGGFDGILDGKNAIIRGVATKQCNDSVFGMFECISGGIVENLKFDNIFIDCNDTTCVGVLAGKIEYSTVSNIKFEKSSDTALFSGTPMKAQATQGASRIYISAPNAEKLGLVGGEVINSKIDSINISLGDNKYITFIAGRVSVGLVVGEFKGDLGLLNSVNITGSDAWVFLCAEYAGGGTYVGGVAGSVSNKAEMRAIRLSGFNAVIGNKANTVSAGSVSGQILDVDSKLTDVIVSFNTSSSAANFVYSESTDIYNGKGLYVLANPNGGYGNSKLKADTTGKVGGIVGYNEGQIINNSSVEETFKGVVKAHAGYIGGLVGVNAGRVSGFNLKTGYSDSYYGIMTMAWIEGKNSADYGVGGLVGANLGSNLGRTVQEIGPDEFYITQQYKGIVDDCSISGQSNTTGAANKDWKGGHVYVFIRTSPENDKYETIETDTPDSPLGTSPNFLVPHFALMYGGIVGFNSGSVINCFVNKGKMTYNLQHNAGDGAININPLGEHYSWGFLSGLIVGYHDPVDKAQSGGFDMAYKGSQWSNYPSLLELIQEDMLAYRIQGCVATNSAIAAVGRVFLDYSNAWSATGIYLETTKAGISMAGICGGSSLNAATGYGINGCRALGNKFIYDAKAGGMSIGANKSGNAGWNYRSNVDNGISINEYFHEMIHAYNVVELSVGAISSGLNNETEYNGMTYTLADVSHIEDNGETQTVVIDERVNGGTIWYTSSDDQSSYEGKEACVFPNEDSTTGVVCFRNQTKKVPLKDPKEAPAGPSRRYTHYASANSEHFGSVGQQNIDSHMLNGLAIIEELAGTNSGQITAYTGNNFSEDGAPIEIQYGNIAGTYINKQAVKTDMASGLPYYVAYSSVVLRQGAPLASAVTNGTVIRTFTVMSDIGATTTWTIYAAPLDRAENEVYEYPSAGEEPNPNTSIFCIRNPI